MFTDKIELKDFDKMDPEYKELLGRVLTIQADCEIGGPHLYIEKMLPAAPTKLDQLIVARTAAEEIDHFRKVARLAGDMGTDVTFVLSQPNEKRFVDAFRGLITTWEDNAVFGFLIDRIGRYQLEEFYDCSYLPLQRILPDIVTEELGHIEYGYNKTLELLSKGDQQRERVQKAIDYWYVRALDMFGRSGSTRAERYRYWGLKRRSNEQAREDYIKEVNPILAKHGAQNSRPAQRSSLHLTGTEVICRKQHPILKNSMSICRRWYAPCAVRLNRAYRTRTTRRPSITRSRTVKRSSMSSWRETWRSG